jgi:hypothetical protein
MISYKVIRGNHKEIVLTPWRHKDGSFHLLKRKGDTPVRVISESDIPSYLDKGYSLRMGNREERHSPSLIRPESIERGNSE